MRIDIAVFDGVDEMDALGPLEVVRTAARIGADVDVRFVTCQPQDVVTGLNRLRFLADGAYSAGADVLLVPGGGWSSRNPAGAWGEVQRGDWLPLLKAARATTSVMAGVCTGTMLLAHAGVVGTRRASTHHAALDDLAATGATFLRDRVVDDGKFVTSGGVTSGIDLALWLVERQCSRELADRVARGMEYQRERPTNA
jgi:transcriptional regulator GlxA family with amidase domain